MRRNQKRKSFVAGSAAVILAAAVGLFVMRSGETPGAPRLSAAEPGQASAAPRGAWTVAEASGGGFLGYRVQESFAGIGGAEAVGRTTAVAGQVEIRGTRAVNGRITADLRQLRSDEPRRDSRIRSDGLQSDQYPTATFDLDRPVALGRASTARGRLNLHGVSLPITMAVQSRIDDARIEIVGTVDITFAQFRMRPPSIAGFVSVRPDAAIEVRLILQRVAGGGERDAPAGEAARSPESIDTSRRSEECPSPSPPLAVADPGGGCRAARRPA